MILAAVYMLWAFQRVVHRQADGRERQDAATSPLRELVVVVPLLALSLFLGLYPKPVLDRIEPTVKLRIAQPRAQERLPPARAAGDRQGDPEGRREVDRHGQGHDEEGEK